MKHSEKQNRLKALLSGLSRQDKSAMTDRADEFVAPVSSLSMESVGGVESDEISVEAAQEAVRKTERGESLTPGEMISFEAIILPRERPVTYIENDDFEIPDDPWGHFARGKERENILKAIPSIGRVELPDHPSIPYGGTAFVVGEGLLMTNRHVAELFASGRGFRDLAFRPSSKAAWDPRREKDQDEDDTSTRLTVTEVLMIHPFWDMAILRVAGLTNKQRPLTLSLETPERLAGDEAEIAVIGYPAMDQRNDLALQRRIFGTFNVKRLQPGKIKPRATIHSFENDVSAMTHDSSTLGGNSGSALVDVKTGEVVGLHFAGLYLKANYAVPTYELARDPRVVELGVRFASGSVGANSQLNDLWIRFGRGGRPVAPSPATTPEVSRPWRTTVSVPVSIGGRSTSLPLSLSLDAEPSRSTRETIAIDALEATLRQPVVFPDLDDRRGFDPDFLGISKTKIFLPELTPAGLQIAAPVDGGGHELKYHKFSIVMHKQRRMALFTAANVDWRDDVRTINGRRPTRRELTNLPDGAAEQWVTDERLAEKYQLPDVFFTKDQGAFDKGHLVRRDDVCWGTSFKDIQKGNGDTYHATNCSPQVAGFNQSAKGEDNWGDLENMVQKQAHAERVIIFSGPVLSSRDLRFEGVDKRGEVSIQIPSSYWKIIIASGDDGPEAFGFVLKQDLKDVPLEFAVPKVWKRFLRPIDEIEKLLFGWASFNAFKAYDQYDALVRRRNNRRR
jgi:endonuclease G